MPAPSTHLTIDRRLCGRPLDLAPGRARVELETVPEMAADERGLVHGGFVFGCADYAAMLAIDEPLVVLAAAEVRFLAPVAVGERLLAQAVEETAEGRMRPVAVRVSRLDAAAGAGHVAGGAAGEAGEPVFEGRFECAVPARHVLDRRRKEER